MYRSWAYILMTVATLAGVVALIWPGPEVRTVEEITMEVRPPPRVDPPVRASKASLKAAKQPSRSAPRPAPPAVVERMPRQNTATRRAVPVLQNGLQPTMNLGAPPAPGSPRPAPGVPTSIRSLHPARPPGPPPPPPAPTRGVE